MTLQEANFNRCCDFIARMIEKYGDSIEFAEKPVLYLICETIMDENMSVDFTLCVDFAACA